MPLSNHRQIAISSPLGDNVLVFSRLRGTEKLGQLFEYQIEMHSTAINLKIKDLLGQNLAIEILLHDGSVRHIHGLVTRFVMSGMIGRHGVYEVTLRPWTWLLTRSADCRIFQNKSVLEIVTEVCHKSAYSAAVDLQSELSAEYPPLPFCVQYRETDFHFITRLMEQVGIYTFYRHDAARHTLVLADSFGAHQPLKAYSALEFRLQESSRHAGEEAIYRWSSGGEIESSTSVLNDFDFERTAASIAGSLLVNTTLTPSFGQHAYETFDYPGGYQTAADGHTISRARAEAAHGTGQQIDAATSARGLSPGGIFTLAEHPAEDQKGDYLVTGAQLHIENGRDGASGSIMAEQTSFSCDISAVSKQFSYRPAPTLRKPVVQGPQTAIVVGPDGEEIHTDKYGRVKVQFHWDRLGTANEKSTCFVRVAQGWAGKQWGSMFIPRIGQEVVIDFLEGDPDRPLITGSVYNSSTMPPYELPKHATRSTIKSNSSKGGGGFNELRFEDKAGSEQVFMHAEKNLDTFVKSDAYESIGNDRHLKIKQHRHEKIGGDSHFTLAGDLNQKVGGSASLDAGSDVHHKAAMKYGIDAGMDLHIKAGMNVVIEAGASITLKAGAGFIVIGPASVAISGMPILLNSGGSAGSGAGISPKAPVEPKEADDGSK